ncbi:hypothetical protein RJ639_008931 [Escallonia herrerae]|uniref:Uncharacterized protein n=1 Tax=Escallonia herrerae TaxID=1293975 RepID=A0AA89AU55_9ASTE|nr:hypothetical protein RJ639_008931 [Escallonia herrerae]
MGSFSAGEEAEQLSPEKLQGVGWSYRPLEETLVDSIESFRVSGIERNVIWNYRICTTHKIPQILTLKIGFHAHSPILVVCAYKLFYTILGRTTSSTN